MNIQESKYEFCKIFPIILQFINLECVDIKFEINVLSIEKCFCEDSCRLGNDIRHRLASLLHCQNINGNLVAGWIHRYYFHHFSLDDSKRYLLSQSRNSNYASMFLQMLRQNDTEGIKAFVRKALNSCQQGKTGPWHKNIRNIYLFKIQ